MAASVIIHTIAVLCLRGNTLLTKGAEVSILPMGAEMAKAKARQDRRAGRAAHTLRALAPAESETVSFRVPGALARKAKAMAEREGLTLTQVFKALLSGYAAGRFRVELSVSARNGGERGD